ncbi:MAG: HAD family hydrolase [Nitrososphaeraceae archaeon]
MVFDKTGTLTRGKPSVTDIVDLSGIGETELTYCNCSIGITTPLGQAAINYAKEKGVMIPNPYS